MRYLILMGSDRNEAQSKLNEVLDRENVVIMFVFGSENEEIAEKASEVAENGSINWWVVWWRNLDLMTDNQKAQYYREGKVVCTLSRKKLPVEWLEERFAKIPVKLENAFNKAEGVD